MVKSFIKVIRKENIADTNPFYGKVISTQKFEECVEFDKDEREDIAPHGISLNLYVFDDITLSIEVSKHYLSSEGDNNYGATFEIGNNTFELSITFNDKGEIDYFELQQWLEYASFVDSEDCDFRYCKGAVGIVDCNIIDL